ncbi:hypothetical protein ACUBGW_27905, partial [Escherichia coli]|uniref:hypothetical protein n=1 Tax=Escherichia coli TaxID=562 RepID=UPI00403C0797
EWVHVQLHQQKGMISLSPPTICNSAISGSWSVSAFIMRRYLIVIRNRRDVNMAGPLFRNRGRLAGLAIRLISKHY